MYKLSERNMLLRAHVELPASFRFATEKFREDWDLIRTGNAERLRKKTVTHGWTLVKIEGSSLHSGVGATAQMAIACAVKLALRHVSEHSNAVEVERIELTQYPWFFLAKVLICSYLIQQCAMLPIYDDAAPPSAVLIQKRSSSSASDPYFRCAMPQLRQMLTIPQDSQPSEQ